MDPEIVIVNIGNRNRAFIGDLLLKIDSCTPIVIAIDALFIGERDKFQDSALAYAFKKIDNDIIATSLDSLEYHAKIPLIFREFVKDEGFIEFEKTKNLVSRLTPVRELDGQKFEHFALKIIENWKPDFKHRIPENKSVKIRFIRTLKQFVHLDYTDIISSDMCKYVKGKVVILGYTGPGNEEKYFSPIQLVKGQNLSHPETYGVVIIANAIRTILEYEDKE